ncbi:hypothetical protein IW148_003284 [Coemansia sp. RSA 1199]|nr:hypothetical protein IW148_003284 [Coemansia sp. RSA 1199]
MAASFGRQLRAWKIDTDVRLAFSVRENSAKSLAICPSGECIAYAGYLRKVAVFSLTTRAELYAQQFVVDTVDQVDIFYNLLALRKRNSCEVFDWKLDQRVCWIKNDVDPVCDIKLCSKDWLLVVTRSWTVHVYSVSDGSLAHTVDSLCAVFDTPFPQHSRRLKILCPDSSVIHVFLFNDTAYASFSLHTGRFGADNFQSAKFPVQCGAKARVLDAHFAHMVALSQTGTITHSANGHTNALSFPRPNRLFGEQPHIVHPVLSITAIDDDTAVLGFNNMCISLLRFTQ